MAELTPVFVYGTLKHGQRAANLLAGQRCLGPAQTAVGFVLYQLDGYPGLIEEPGSGTTVVGELWLVDDACIRALDAYEGVAEGLYRRQSIAIATEGLPSRADTYVYAQSLAGRRRIGATWPPAP